MSIFWRSVLRTTLASTRTTGQRWQMRSGERRRIATTTVSRTGQRPTKWWKVTLPSGRASINTAAPWTAPGGDLGRWSSIYAAALRHDWSPTPPPVGHASDAPTPEARSTFAPFSAHSTAVHTFRENTHDSFEYYYPQNFPPNSGEVPAVLKD